jgi:hypothetical protein
MINEGLFCQKKSLTSQSRWKFIGNLWLVLSFYALNFLPKRLATRTRFLENIHSVNDAPQLSGWERPHRNQTENQTRNPLLKNRPPQRLVWQHKLIACKNNLPSNMPDHDKRHPNPQLIRQIAPRL